LSLPLSENGGRDFLIRETGMVAKLKARPSFIDKHVAATIKSEPAPDKLETIRSKMRDLRDIELQASDVEVILNKLKENMVEIREKELPDLMTEIGIDRLGLEAEGNLPAYDLTLKKYYYARIGKDDPTASDAYRWLIENDHEDLIKTIFEIVFTRGSHKEAVELQKQLDKLKVVYTVSQGVPWNTLTAFLKEQVEKHNTVPPLNLMNGKIGVYAELKPRKKKGEVRQVTAATTF
jgi:hypothetical protein